MKLATSGILIQLSDQQRSDIERELAGVNQRFRHLQQQQQEGRRHISQLNRQRDQITKQRNSAALLQDLNASMNEHVHMLAALQSGIVELEEQKHNVLGRMKAACRTQHAYETAHHKEEHRLQRQQTLHNQQELDDLVASRATAHVAGGNA